MLENIGCWVVIIFSRIEITTKGKFDYADYVTKKIPRKSTYDHWMNLPIGSSDCHIVIDQIQKRNELIVELYIDNDKELFHNLHDHKDEIEKDLGFSLDWRELPERKASRIITMEKAKLNNKDKWQEQFDWLIDTVLKMRAAFKKHL